MIRLYVLSNFVTTYVVNLYTISRTLLHAFRKKLPRNITLVIQLLHIIVMYIIIE